MNLEGIQRQEEEMVHMVTGGLGFIGSHLVQMLLERDASCKVVIVDLITYAANESFWPEIRTTYPGRVFLEVVDIRRTRRLIEVMEEHKVENVFHLAAESHVCRSLHGPEDFYTTNILGTHSVVQAFLAEAQPKRNGRFLHVSTDEVFGELPLNGGDRFDESSPIQPRSPYATSKACSDLVVQAAVLNYGLRAVITNCSNNYGPRQHDEKLVPKAIGHILRREPVPLYGGGHAVRDWINVEDHCHGLVSAIEAGRNGERYCLGGETEINVRDMVNIIHDLIEEVTGQEYPLILKETNDRPNDDLRYAIDNTKARTELGWAPEKGDFRDRLRATVEWYVQRFQGGLHDDSRGGRVLGQELSEQG